ncbi:MAG: glycoside hydrolase family 3 C-terminal domain-containing protein [Lachnospiraceae bacterium]|nr:glycoside hydrolase family 3 C-terminal domain-containing protein [Lachnospiraceae bacterium]
MKKRLWKGLCLLTICLCVMATVGSRIAFSYEAMLNEFLGIETSRVTGGDGNVMYYPSAYADLGTMLQDKMQLLKEIADEGVVLLKNDGVLPFDKGSIGIFGGENFIIATESGGGKVTPSMRAMSLTLEEALTLGGLKVQSEGCDLALVVIGRSVGEGTDAPKGSLTLTEKDRENVAAAKASGGKVIILLSGDHAVEAMELKDDPEIAAVLKLGNAGFRGAFGIADVITGKVNPSGKLPDTYAANIDSIPAAVNFGNFVYTNGGKIRASQAKNYVVYAEGIYVDYRYFETRYEDAVLGQGNTAGWKYEDEVIWPFGYGLSYTTFEKKIMEVSFDEAAHTATLKVEVTNTGSVSGKEVVQVYAQAPYTDYDRKNQVEKASVQLMGYEKTSLLAPGAAETLEVTVPLQWLASFDYVSAKGYILDAGDYYFSVGNGAHEAVENILAAKGKSSEGDATLTYTWKQDALDTKTFRTSVYTGNEITRSFAEADINTWIPGTLTYMTRSDWAGTYPESIELTASAEMLSVLNDTKRYESGNGNDTKARGDATPVSYRPASTLEEVNETLSKQGSVNALSMRGKAYDDAGWDEILDTLTIYEISRTVAQGRNFIQAMPSVTTPSSSGGDSPIGRNVPYKYEKVDSQTGAQTAVGEGYAFTDSLTGKTVSVNADLQANMYASEPVLAATFNKELAKRQGQFWAEDALYTGDAFQWAPGANLHRTPYGGRASEYCSADPVHTSLTLIPLLKAASEKGLVLTVKHFAINEQEQNRIGIGTFTNEQALRELYLRAFEGAMTYGESRGMMSSYNRIGLISTATEYDLITGVLRNEWGSNAYVITDLGSPTAGLYDGNATIAAGVSTMMNNGVYDDPTKAYVNQTLTPENIANDPVLLRASREACHRILYNFIHSNAVNGIAEDARIELIVPWWQTALTITRVITTVLAAISTLLYLIAANRKES